MEKSRLKKVHISAGAIVIRKLNNQKEVLLLYRKKSKSWHLPKGTKKKNECLEHTAQREVLEETGTKIKIRGYLGYLKSKKEDQTSKITHYFLAESLSSNLQNHNQEHDYVEFVEIKEAIKRLQKKALFEKEASLLKKLIKKF